MTTSRLVPDFVPLDQGLNLQVAKITAPPGTVLDSLNYEQVDFLGQKRIDGYVRYDGSLRSDQDILYVVSLAAEGVNETFLGHAVLAGEEIVGVGAALGADGASVVIAIINENLVPEVGDELTFLPGTYEVTAVEELATVVTPSEQYQTILESNQALRDRVTSLPGPVAGLHWFNDRLYAVASALRIDVGSGHGYQPNDDYAGFPVLAVDTSTIVVGGVGDGGAGVTSEVATLFQSRSEQQALDELGDVSQHGWDFIHQGWSVPFENGVSLYGSLPALNLNINGVGVSGSTPITGNNGRALSLTQKVEVTNRARQVNGWKTSSSPGVYNLEVSALSDVDTLYIYADAYFRWDGTTGEVTAPGVDSPLDEYPANNAVVVEV